VALVAAALLRDVTDYEYFSGRTDASNKVDVRSRVTGYLEKAAFTEGDVVKAGDLLFVIDQRPYKAELAKAEGALAQAEARLLRMEGDFERIRPLAGRGRVTSEEYELRASDRDEARAAKQIAQANLDLAKLNLKYTEVRAPFAGRISRRQIDPGNLVKADDTILTTLVTVEPTYAYFDVDERTLLRQMLKEGTLAARQGPVEVELGLVDEDGYPHRGQVNFVDKPSRPIPPGLYVRVRFPLGRPHPAVLVAEQALGSDQGQKFLYVVGSNNKVAYRRVQLGRQHGGLREIKEGVRPGEQVVVSGLQRVRADIEVRPEKTDMLAVASPAADQPRPQTSARASTAKKNSGT
jgi:membrane fusion protein, multidrug efflux system